MVTRSMDRLSSVSSVAALALESDGSRSASVNLSFRGSLPP